MPSKCKVVLLTGDEKKGQLSATNVVKKKRKVKKRIEKRKSQPKLTC